MKCRSCNHLELHSIIPLGLIPLANAFIDSAEFLDSSYNLEVMLCPNCGLAQLKDLVDPKELFSHYLYLSSNSETMLSSAESLVHKIIPSLSEDAFVIEIASNDGYLLKNYVKNGINVLGIDPAKNIAKIANENRVPTLCTFFSLELAQQLVCQGKRADIIHANNVMAHINDINGFIAGIQCLLKEHGIAIIEVPYFLDLVENLEFDTIYHEHVYYFSLQPLRLAFARHNLEIFNIEKLSIHGGTLRLYVARTSCQPVSPAIEAMEKHEREMGLYDLEKYRNFMQKINTLKENLQSFLKSLKSKNKKIAAYGASAKGTTLLNYFNIGKEYLDFIVDISPIKQGLKSPGSNLEIKHPRELINEKIDHAMLLAWNFSEEIISQQKEFIMQGGKFILPLPEVKILT